MADDEEITQVVESKVKNLVTEEIRQIESKVKNPKRVAAGKRMAAKNKKDKEELYATITEIKNNKVEAKPHTSVTLNEDKTVIMHISEQAPLIVSVIALSLALYLWSNKVTPHPGEPTGGFTSHPGEPIKVAQPDNNNNPDIFKML